MGRVYLFVCLLSYDYFVKALDVFLLKSTYQVLLQNPLKKCFYNSKRTSNSFCQMLPKALLPLLEAIPNNAEQ